jgi:hypothetical protein
MLDPPLAVRICNRAFISVLAHVLATETENNVIVPPKTQTWYQSYLFPDLVVFAAAATNQHNRAATS